MPADATPTRERILDAAQRLVIGKGFASASVDAIQEAAGISRGTFFYHFPTKDDLSRALIERHAKNDRGMTDEFLDRAERLARDPLEQVHVYIGLLEELFQDQEAYEPGCLFASYSYEAGLFDEATHRLILETLDYGRDRLARKLEEVIRRHPPRIPVDATLLADMGNVVLQGAFVLSRVRSDVSLMVAHLRQYRDFLRLVFEEPGGAGDGTGGGRVHPEEATTPAGTSS